MQGWKPTFLDDDYLRIEIRSSLRQVPHLAKRCEKPKMARYVVLFVGHRGGRFLRRGDIDSRLCEIGDEKAEDKTSQALMGWYL